MTDARPPTFEPRRPFSDRTAVVIDLASRRPYRAPSSAQPSSGWYHEAALRDANSKPPRFV